MTPISNYPRMQMYAYGATQVSRVAGQAFGQNSEVSQMCNKLPSILNGSYDPTAEMVNSLPIKNPIVKQLIGSVLDILMTWLAAGKGADKADAKKAEANANASSDALKGDMQQTEAKGKNLTDETKAKVDEQTAVMEGNEEQNKSLEEQNNEANAEIQKRQEDNERIDQELAEYFANNSSQTPIETDENGKPDYGKVDPEPYKEATTKSGKNVGELLEKRKTNCAVISASQATIDTNTPLIEQGYQQIDQAATGIMSTIQGARGAVNELTDLMTGKKKMFTQEQLISASTQLIKSGINGAEGGVLSAFATAAGASSIVSFGSTATQAVQAAEAAGDKFASVPARIASQMAIKLVEQMTKSVITNALQNLSSVSGVNFTQMYTDAMQIYAMASEGNVNKEAPTAGGDQPKTEQPQGEQPKNEQPKNEEPKNEPPAQA